MFAILSMVSSVKLTNLDIPTKQNALINQFISTFIAGKIKKGVGFFKLIHEKPKPKYQEARDGLEAADKLLVVSSRDSVSITSQLK